MPVLKSYLVITKMNQDQIKKLATVASIGLGAYFFYRVLLKNQKPAQAVKDTIEKPVEVVETVLRKTKNGLTYFAKGSQEAKDHMKKLAAMRGKNKKSKKKKSGGHKGHKTKRGLAQDQKRTSKEKHEKEYRKYKKGRYDK